MTGYIAGDALYELYQKHPDYEYAALVRTQEKADIVKKAFPNVRIVLGGNDDSDILKEEAAKADIVLREFSVGLVKFINCLLTLLETLRMLLTMRELRRLSLRAFALATQRRSPATGCTPVARVF